MSLTTSVPASITTGPSSIISKGNVLVEFRGVSWGPRAGLPLSTPQKPFLAERGLLDPRRPGAYLTMPPVWVREAIIGEFGRSTSHC